MKHYKNKKKSLKRRFLRVFLLSFITLFLLSGITIASYVYIVKQYREENQDLSDLFDFGSDKDEDIDGEEEIEQEEKLYVAVYGVDEDGYRTDVIMLTVVDLVTKDVNIISIPRDTRIELPDEMYARLKSRRSDTPKTLKLNGVPAYAPSDERNEYAVEALESLLSVEIDYYIKIDLAAFREVVDLIGGVAMYIPDDMNYSAPDQDLYINLKAGQQTLNGAQAEQLVRFRSGYADADLGRIRMQHEFMKEFVAQVLSEENKMNFLNILKATLESADTDITFTEAAKYGQFFLSGFNVNQLEMGTLPGEGGAYFMMDYDATQELLYNIENYSSLTAPEIEEEAPEEPEEISSIDKTIEVLNSTSENGLAGKIRDTLEEDGFTVAKVGNYLEATLETTQIIVTEEGMGQDLITYFNQPVLKVDQEALPDGVDIQIIIGTDK